MGDILGFNLYFAVFMALGLVEVLGQQSLAIYFEKFVC